MGKVLVSADLKQMFLQTKAPEGDRDTLCFLWWAKNDLDKPIVEHGMTAHPFGAASSPFCANYALRETMAVQRQPTKRAIVESVTGNFHVDDYLGSVGRTRKAFNRGA